MSKQRWTRVSKTKRCPICNHDSWCIIAPDGGAVICGRVESNRRINNSGWLHKIGQGRGFKLEPRRIKVELPTDFSAKAAECRETLTKLNKLEPLSERLGVSAESLRRLGVGFLKSENAWTFPLCDGSGTKVIGLSRRFCNGEKKVMASHKTGLYVPTDLPPCLEDMTLLICEGGSDTAAGLDLGFWAVGRFACTHGAAMLTTLVKSRKPKRVVIVGDTDEPGQLGADDLSSALVPYVSELRMIFPPPPHKDLRNYVQAGATNEELTRLIEAAPIRKMNVRIA